MPGLQCSKEQFFNKVTHLDTLFGFYYCNVECSKDNYLGLLPATTNTGIFLPTGKWSGWYFSEQLKFARDNGYKISVVKGYSFNRSQNIFDKYIYDIYNNKSNSKYDVQKSMAKSLLNNLLGRFGITDIISSNSFNNLSTWKRLIVTNN